MIGDTEKGKGLDYGNVGPNPLVERSEAECICPGLSAAGRRKPLGQRAPLGWKAGSGDAPTRFLLSHADENFQ
jgi:hypothetical protein